MHELIIENQTFEAQNYRNNALKKADYDTCVFKDCDFSESNLRDIVFSECRFESCNLSLADLSNASLKEVSFINCKLVGSHFSECNDFLLEMAFDHCIMKMVSFYKVDLQGTVFKNCQLHEADFSEANLEEAVFEDCDLHDAVFSRTNLQKADLSSAVNYTIDPELNRIEKALFTLQGLPGLLQKHNIQIE